MFVIIIYTEKIKLFRHHFYHWLSYVIWFNKRTFLLTLNCFFLFRNNSTKDLESFAETAISINRMMQQHLAISEQRTRGFGKYQSTDSSSVKFILSPPGSSSLARRRAASSSGKSHSSDDYADSANGSLGSSFSYENMYGSSFSSSAALSPWVLSIHYKTTKTLHPLTTQFSFIHYFLFDTFYCWTYFFSLLHTQCNFPVPLRFMVPFSFLIPVPVISWQRECVHEMNVWLCMLKRKKKKL